MCLVFKQQCQSFLYNDGSKNCTLGSVLVPTLPANTSPSAVTYKMVQSCDLASGFKVITLNNTSACVWISPVAANFTSARDTCRAKHSYVYTPKSLGQMNILVNVSVFQGQLVWLGLTDLVQENVLVWEDDGYVMPYSQRTALFNDGEPSGGVTENCVVLVRPPDRRAADVKCSDLCLFMCDIGDFTQ
ncbi:tetranectin-like [Physella acuta]|uniref:tetranectin-like n=1 Tax=Physella acuta TaxID=109671 RepID=UPI0027DD1D35|nr:tetranectin-like [Physella acuta]